MKNMKKIDVIYDIGVIFKSRMKTNGAQHMGLEHFCQRSIQVLQDFELIKCESNSGLSSLPFGAVMAKYFLSINTIKAFRGFRGNETISDILDKIVYYAEFSEFYLRRDEKKMLNDINKKIRYPIPGNITTMQQKISCLLQAILGDVPIESTALLLDAEKMLQIADRMVNSLIEYFQTDQFTQNCHKSVLSPTTLAKSIKTRTWENLQFHHALGLPERDVNMLIRSGIDSVDIFLKTNPREIEDILQKDLLFGNELIDKVAKKLPCYDVSVNVMSDYVIRVRVTHSNIRHEYEAGRNDALILIVGDSCNQLILYEDIQSALNEDGFYEKLLCCTSSAYAGFAHLIHRSLVGVDKVIRFKTKKSQDEETISVMSEMVVSSTTPVSVVPTFTEETIPVNAVDGQKKGKSFKLVKRPKSIKSVSSMSTNKTGSSNQSSLSQYFRTVGKPQSILKKPSTESVFDSGDCSPILLKPSTQILSQLYDYSHETENNSQRSNKSITNNPENDKENDSLGVNSPSLAQTPLCSKLNEQVQSGNAINGFVCAKTICRKDIPSEPSQNVHLKPNQNENVTPANISKSPFRELECELDSDFMGMIQNELIELDQNNSKPVGLAQSNFLTKSTLENLNLNLNLHTSEIIRKDFEDPSDCVDNSEAFKTTKQLECVSIDDRNSFFSANADEDNEKNTIAQKNLIINQASHSMPRNPAPVNNRKVTVAPLKINEINHSRQNISYFQSPASVSSDQAVCGSPFRRIPSPMDRRQNASKRAADFSYAAPRQMQAPRDHAQPNQFFDFELHPLVPGPMEPKRKKTFINDLLAQSEYGEQIRKSSRASEKKAITRMSHKNVLASVSHPATQTNRYADAEKCRQRLKNIGNYEQKDLFRILFDTK